MMVTCKCGKEFLTEADPHVVIPSSKGYGVNCGCFLTAENEKLKRIVEVLEKANDFYADTKSWGELELDTDEYWNDYESLNPEKPRLMTGGRLARQAKEEVERIRKGATNE